MKLQVLAVIMLLLAASHSADLSIEEKENEAAQYMDNLGRELTIRRNLAAEAEWDFQTNITDENERRLHEVATENAKFSKEKAKEVREFDYQNFRDESLKRQFKKISILGYAELPEEDYKELRETISKMEGNYGKTKVCSYTDRTKCDLGLNPELENIISKNRDPEELKYYWKEWYDKAGTSMRPYFDKYIRLNKKAALLNGFKSGAEMWLHEYDDDTFEKQLENIFDEIRPFYEQIHGYVRWRLRKHYGNDIVPEKGPIPMHLLGNMWAQSWGNIADIVQPFQGKALLDVTEEMIKQGYTPIKMFEKGDEFFQSLNMTKLPPSFWDKSVFVKPNDGREIVCHASAWDFYKTDDVRIKMCTKVNMEDFFTVHHELGHIQYFLQYQHLPHLFRDGANPGFHEAVGDVLSLSVSTPKHLEAIGLLKDFKPDFETKINQLFLTALGKIVFLPFAYTLDKYRWGVFRGEIEPKDYNCAFWKLREQYSGIEPPVERTEADFDPPAKYHISADVEYIRYLVSYIIQFQFYESACKKAGQYVPGNPEYPLDNCDIYGSADAGNAFKAMLSLGASRPWPDAMEVFTGERKMSATSLMQYFGPLITWLEEENKKNNVPIGWDPSEKCK